MAAQDRERIARLVRVTGLVQGVGFRPTVYRIAAALNLSGEVFNDAQGVGVRIEGERAAVEAFAKTLVAEKPPLARIDEIRETEEPVRGLEGFRITASREGGRVTTAITADAATCRACFADMFDRGNRRWRYAFTNCTHCGPRFTITRHLPYDRPQTSMAAFPMCPDCRREYENPLDRRFHAQPNACPVCGPQLELLDAEGQRVEGDPVRLACEAIRRGETVAIKGIGGFHLVCDAKNAEAVARLRRRKRRDEKPLAVMCANIASAQAWVELTEAEKALLLSPAHPIVLARKKPGADAALPGVSDGLAETGVMLPYTPLHALLFHTLAGEPEGLDWLESEPHPDLLVMTSANPGGEPLVIKNDEALRRLAPMADAYLVHNREILVRCDDSVVRVMNEKPVWVRRSRGLTPEAVKLSPPEGAPASVLALGPYLKNTACLTRGAEAFLTQHVGDLENAVVCEALEEAAAHLEDILDVKPEAYACDLHPDFFSTALAHRLAEASGKPVVAVAHHAAHIGAVMAEAGRTERTLGLALDGVGLGPDGHVWGGELLAVGATCVERLGHLRTLPIPGGDRAAREPWRMGAAALVEMGREDLIELFFGSMPGAKMIAALARSPRTLCSSALGRWYDAAAALLGITLVQHDEATAAMRLESLGNGSGAVLEDGWRISRDGVLDLLPLFKAAAEARAADMHSGRWPESRAWWAGTIEKTMAHAIAQWALAAAKRDPDGAFMALSGGCFLNRTLEQTVREAFAAAGAEARLSHAVPPGDGGLALGQAWLAMLAIARGRTALDYVDRTEQN